MLALGAQAGRTGQAAGRAGSALGAARHGRCRQRARGRAEQTVAGAQGPRQAGRRRWARGLGARAGLELCTQCTRPVFGPVRLGIFLSQIFWTLFVNSVHEHCSARIFSKKKNIFKKYLKIN